MQGIQIVPMNRIGFGFIEEPFVLAGQDEYYLRNQQTLRPATDYRRLEPREIETMVRNNNTCDDWNNILVTSEFHPEQIHDCDFRGLVRIGRLEPVYLEYHDLRLPAGLYRSSIISCDIGDNVALHNVTHISNYIVGDLAILINVNEIVATNHAKFGNGILKDGEAEEVRVWMQLWNETGTRGVLPFDGMTPADALLWCRYRAEPELLAKFMELTQRSFDPRRGFYGTIGRQAIVKDCRILKDVKIGDRAYVKGANKLKNLTINSSQEEPSQIGEGCELVNGIVGYGCKIFYGVKAVRFVTGRNCQLKYGARLINSYLGDNSTVSCCELLNNLIFPAHEQHHNNSFLCASLLLGQSNIAAGATIGSNHNSRANDGEILAGRGFWPGLCTSFKHNSRFASFCLVAKGDYPAELDIRLPFALVSNDAGRDRLTVMPAYWFMYNMYALARNAWKFAARDQRVHKVQHIEFDYLAPDTVEEIFTALELLELWTAKASYRHAGAKLGGDEGALRRLGRELLASKDAAVDKLEVLGELMENGSRPTVILKARQAWAEFRKMINYYGVKTLAGWLEGTDAGSGAPRRTLAEMCATLAGPRSRNWTNLGGQLVTAEELRDLKARIMELRTWDEVHAEYDRLWQGYDDQKARHALASLLDLHGLGPEELTAARWGEFVDRAVATQFEIAERTFKSRAKDYENHFKQITFSNPEEMTAVMGRPEENGFIIQVREESQKFAERLARLK